MLAFKTFCERDQMSLLESGLSRINSHLNSGKDLAILSSVTGEDASHSKHVQMIKHVRSLGYGPIESTGRTEHWGSERSVVVPNMSLGHAKQVGNKFDQQAIIHYKGKTKTASQHWLKDTDEHKKDEAETLGAAHFNKPFGPNVGGISALKGAGYRPKDDRSASRSFTFTKEEINKGSDFILEKLEWPPRGMFSPNRRPFIVEPGL